MFFFLIDLIINHMVFSTSPRLQRGWVFPPDLAHFYTAFNFSFSKTRGPSMSDLGISHRGSEALSGGRYRLPAPASSRGVEDYGLSIQEVRMPRPPGGRTAA